MLVFFCVGFLFCSVDLFFWFRYRDAWEVWLLCFNRVFAFVLWLFLAMPWVGVCFFANPCRGRLF